MAVDATSPVGVFLHGMTPPADVARLSRLVEDLGFGELWFAEDCYMLGGFTSVAVALQATQRIPVGLGAVSSVVRHPAITAMEAATLMNAYPGRVNFAVGHGAVGWTRQMGVFPKSLLGSMRESVTSIKRLLDGQTLSEEGAYFSFDGIRLERPVENAEVLVAAVGTRSVELAGEIADGLLVSVLAGPKYVEYAKERLSAARQAHGRGADVKLPVYALACVDRDGKKARALARKEAAFYLEVMPGTPMTGVYGVNEQLAEMQSCGDLAYVEREMPEAWLDWLVVAGEPEECVERIQALLDTGATSVALTFIPVETAQAQIELAAAEILPKFK